MYSLTLCLSESSCHRGHAGHAFLPAHARVYVCTKLDFELPPQEQKHRLLHMIPDPDRCYATYIGGSPCPALPVSL